MQGYMMHEQLLASGMDSVLLHVPDGYDIGIIRSEKIRNAAMQQQCSVVVFQKVCEGEAENLAFQIRELGIRTIYIACNTVGRNMVETCDKTIAVSSYLKGWYGYRMRKRIVVIPDSVEAPYDIFKRDYEQEADSLRLVHVGGEAPSENLVRCLAGCGLNVSVTEISGRKKVENVVPEAAMPRGAVLPKRKTHIHPFDFVWKVRSKIGRLHCQRRYGRTPASNHIPVEHLDWDMGTVYDSILQQ